MMKKLFGIVLMVQVLGLHAQEEAQDYSDAFEVAESVDSLDLGVAEKTCVDDCASWSRKGFLCSLWQKIKAFFMTIAGKIRSLFTSSGESQVEMVVGADSCCGSDHKEDCEDTEGKQADDSDEDSDDQENDDDTMKLSKAKRKFLTQEPVWLQQRS